tara:strand:- start:4780 stop:5016 length:237 start_codon:yes stop_codon:yes gene_type:complete
MDIYKISECNEYGQEHTTLGFEKANSEKEALEILSMKRHGHINSEICTTGYYSAKKILMEDYHNERVALIDELSLYNI